MFVKMGLGFEISNAGGSVCGENGLQLYEDVLGNRTLPVCLGLCLNLYVLH